MCSRKQILTWAQEVLTQKSLDCVLRLEVGGLLQEGKAYPEMARVPERSLATLQAEFCGGAGGSAPVSNGVSSFNAAAQLPAQAGGSGALGTASTNGFSGALSSSLPQVHSLVLKQTILACT